MADDDEGPPPAPPPPPPDEDDAKDSEIKTDAASIQYRTIRDGFLELRKSLDGVEDDPVGKPVDGDTDADDAEDDEEKPPDPKIMNAFVAVNFIDPTSPGDSEGKPPVKKQLELYQRLTSTFEEEFHSTLRQVPYKHIRSGRNEIIEELAVRPVLTRTHATPGANGGEALTPWGGAATAPVSDPAEWHNGPFCHVYIAACENMHSYRNKVRPAVQAFVCLLYTSPSPRDQRGSRMPSSA